MMRYLAPFSLRERNRSLKSLGIMFQRSFEIGGEGICSLGYVANREQSLADGSGLPIVVGLGLLLL